MPSFTQANKPIEVITPAGKDVLLITGFRGEEGISRLFHYQVDMVADVKKDIAFDQILGQKVGVRLMSGGKNRFFSGICNRFSQGESDLDFFQYQMEIVPQFWLATKAAQTRIFQQLSVPDILKKVLAKYDVVWETQGTYQPRNYCVQYRETDFNFACRLMEAEGIFYFFTHTADGHKMVVADTAPSHPEIPLISKIIFEKPVSGRVEEDRVLNWQKQQELITGNFLLWDHSFEVHGKNLQAKATVPDSVQLGKVKHLLKAGKADTREVYDYPGDYAVRFDGINSGGGEQPPEVQKIFKDNERTVALRSQQEAVLGVCVNGTSNCRNLVSGHKFSLQKHPNADGDYLLTAVQHSVIGQMDYRTNAGADFRYVNSFTAIPLAMPFRPQRLTPKPFVQGTQTAIVVGTPGEEIFCDKYGRVKVQFHWDRDGTSDAKSSCWVRVASHWAGKQWGQVHVPRIGHEVVVGFEEGDPDQPIIIGSVYNADHMPPYVLPDNKTQSGVKSRSSQKGTPANFNEIRFEDLKGKEQVVVHAEKDMSTSVEANQNNTIGHNHTMTIGTDPNGDPKKDGTSTTTIFGDTKLTITKGNHTVNVQTGAANLFVDANNRVVIVDQQYYLLAKSIYAESASEWIHMKSAADVNVQAATVIQHIIGESANFVKITSGGNVTVSGSAKVECAVGEDLVRITPGKIEVTSTGEVVLSAPGGSIKIDGAGVTIAGKEITSKADGANTVKGAKVDLNP